MTTVLHTADVHLTADAHERREALEEIMGVAEDEEVDVVTIGGDLFDKPSDVENLRTNLRNELFSDKPFEVLLIPGNHDIEAFRSDVFFGESCEVVTEKPFSHWISPEEDLRITALPYHEKVEDDLVLALKNRQEFEGTEILLLHCSLEAPFDRYETGDEDDYRYFPVSKELLNEWGFDYYLAGHYHSHHEVPLSNGSTFFYPGTPASTKRTETGKRRVVLLDTESSKDIEYISLGAFHYANQEFTVEPGNEESTLDRIDEWVKENAVESAEASVRVEGFVEMGEAEFNENLKEATGKVEFENETRSIEEILSHPLYISFKQELNEVSEQEDWTEDTVDGVQKRTMEVFTELVAGGEI
jgi:DNA repair exonuclease SbcCD nuclease subunit